MKARRIVPFAVAGAVAAGSAMTSTIAVGGVSSGSVLGKQVSVCFVGEALTLQPFRVMQVMAYVKQYQYVANIRFEFLGDCPPSRPVPNGNNSFAGDIRIVLPGVSVDGLKPVPGRGCPKKDDNSTWGSWSLFPQDAAKFRSCLYTLKLGSDGENGIPWVNTALHEFGHGLGLIHEHERRDVDRSLCKDKDFGGDVTERLVTRYDPKSVMHYKLCAINGNYDNTGLSPLDQLTLHILYPEDDRIAELVGTTVVPAPQRLALRSAWKLRGANMAFAATSFQWKIGGRVVGTGPDLDIEPPAGITTLEYSYRDFLGRTYSYSGTVNSLTRDAFTKTTSGPVAAMGVLF